MQAAFVEYGGNRQGFLAFSEIHPDYCRIPIEDREKLMAEEEERLANAPSEDDAAEAAKDETDENENAIEASSSENAEDQGETSDDANVFC